MIKSSLKLMGKTYESKGKTPKEAILSLKPEGVGGGGLLILTQGDVVKEKMILPRLVFGLFGKASRLQKEIAEKQIVQLFPNELFK